MPNFSESLNVSVTLSSGGRSTALDGGNIKELRLSLALHGFQGCVRLWVIAQQGGDEFLPLATSSELLTLELSVKKALYNEKPEPEPIRLSAVVTRRSLREVPSPEVRDNPILYREYTLEFCDVPQALWAQHRPSVIYADTTLETVIQEHTPTGVRVRTDWSRLKRRRSIIGIGLGDDLASFYGFLFWIADLEHGHVWYDYAKGEFVLDDAKPSGTALEFANGALENSQAIHVELAPRPRYALNLLNSRSGASPETAVEQPDAQPGVRRDRLLHTALDAEVANRAELEKTRTRAGRFDVTLDCNAYPEMFLVPGLLTTVGEEYGGTMYVSGEPLRVLLVNIHANARNQLPEYDIENDTTEYDVGFDVRLEPDDDDRFRAPEFRPPRYPFEVEGTILSAIGQDGDRTYTVYEGEDSSDVYKVRFELWNTTIIIPVRPDFVPGHLYFPVYKNSRAFLAVGFDSARISRFLDWGQDVTLANASQGNHLLLGKNRSSETSIKHWYAENSPELIIERTHQSDFGTMTLKEGTMVLELTEKAGGQGSGATVSVEPQAQMARAEVEQKSELALAGLEDTTQSGTEQLDGRAREASTAIREQATAMKDDLTAATQRVSNSLSELEQGLDAQTAKVDSVLGDAEGELDNLFSG